MVERNYAKRSKNRNHRDETRLSSVLWAGPPNTNINMFYMP